MKLKRTIQFIEYSNIALIVGLLIGLIALVSKAGDDKLMFLQMLFALPLILAFFFRKLIVNIYLKKSLYPGVFYSVLDKLGLTQKLDIYLSDELLSEIYKPHYSTDQFLKDNNLSAEIGSKKIQLPSIILLLIGFGGLFYFGQKFRFQDNPLALVMSIVTILIGIYLLTQSKKQKHDEPIAFFKSDVLELPNHKFSWKDIYDWNYQPGGKGSSEKIILNYYDSVQNTNEAVIKLSDFNIGKIDFLILLTHFKGKYG
jgi:hypothetical protein